MEGLSVYPSVSVNTVAPFSCCASAANLAGIGPVVFSDFLRTRFQENYARRKSLVINR